MKKSWNVYNYFQKLICNRKIAVPMKVPPGPLGALVTPLAICIVLLSVTYIKLRQYMPLLAS